MSLILSSKETKAAPKYIYTVGCLKAMGSWLKSHALIMVGVIAGVLIPQVWVNILKKYLVTFGFDFSKK